MKHRLVRENHLDFLDINHKLILNERFEKSTYIFTNS